MHIGATKRLDTLTRRGFWMCLCSLLTGETRSNNPTNWPVSVAKIHTSLLPAAKAATGEDGNNLGNGVVLPNMLCFVCLRSLLNFVLPAWAHLLQYTYPQASPYVWNPLCLLDRTATPIFRCIRGTISAFSNRVLPGGRPGSWRKTHYHADLFPGLLRFWTMQGSALDTLRMSSWMMVQSTRHAPLCRVPYEVCSLPHALPRQCYSK